jgi:hypothetical protein
MVRNYFLQALLVIAANGISHRQTVGAGCNAFYPLIMETFLSKKPINYFIPSLLSGLNKKMHFC